MENETKICVDCGQEFEITEGWKKLMAENPDIKEPIRCYNCRQKRKVEKNQHNDFGRDRDYKSRW